MALTLFNAMPEVAIAADVVSFSSAMLSLQKSLGWRLAAQLLEEATEAPDVVIYGAAISACQLALNFQGALSLLRSMDDATRAVLGGKTTRVVSDLSLVHLRSAYKQHGLLTTNHP